jgi:GDPmannose 4,6-dehydratase
LIRPHEIAVFFLLEPYFYLDPTSEHQEPIFVLGFQSSRCVPVKTALICGISGQDGAYLAKLLLEKGYRVVGTSRDHQLNTFNNLKRLHVREDVERCSAVLTDFRSTLQTLTTVKPDEVYNLAGPSSVALSFEQPAQAMESICLCALHLLESIRFLDQPIRFYNASSSECFGDTGPEGASEQTAFSPHSPYAVAKAAAHWLVKSYRESYGIWAVNGILFNHESPLRPERFVTRKVVKAACDIKAGSRSALRLGNLAIQRDWGWASEYVEAIWRTMQLDSPDDLVIGTGEAHSLEAFVSLAFESLGLHWQDHVQLDNALNRPSEIIFNKANAARAQEKIGWKAKATMPDVVNMMVDAELNGAAAH